MTHTAKRCCFFTRKYTRGHVSPTELILSLILFSALALILKIGHNRALFHDKVEQLNTDLKEINRAVESLALDNNFPPGQRVPWEQYRRSLRGDTGDLREEDSDPFGNPYGTQSVGTPAAIPENSLRILKRNLETEHPIQSSETSQIQKQIQTQNANTTPPSDSLNL